MAVESNRMLGGIGAALIVVSAVSPILVLPRLFDLYSTSAGLASPFSMVIGLAGLAGIARAPFHGCDERVCCRLQGLWHL
jgi:hypothetical protein